MAPQPESVMPPGAWEPLARLARLAKRPLERFLRIEAASGVLLLLATAVALLWANSRFANGYAALWQSAVGAHFGAFRLERSLKWIVDDVLMAVFFFVVGMEIRREVHHGELSEWRRAALPMAAALGGMIVPALLYLAVAGAGALRLGWGVPMATDIAFALGILTLLGARVPAALRVLLLALAVIDDLGAIAVIALFYSSGVKLAGLGLALEGVAGVFVLQRLGVRSKVAYAVPSIVVWLGVYRAGIHPTIAGVIVGLMTPVRVWVGHEAHSPAETLIEALHPWVAFGIMPLFALANAGVSLAGSPLGARESLVALAVSVGLFVGKPVGVLLACSLALRLRIATLPKGLSHRHLVVLGLVAGIGFTMALFIAQLAFLDATLLSAAKLGVLAASGLAAVAGLLVGRSVLPANIPAAQTADEAEDSTEL